MSSIVVYYAPNTCARVPMIALEQAGVSFESRLIAFRAKETRTEEYLRLNPAGKVPCLIIDGVSISENVAIAGFLNRRYPEAKLLPICDTDFDRTQIISDLSFCASTLHPFVTRLRLPHYFCDLDGAQDNVWELAAKGMELHFKRIETRLSSDGPWWYGDHWSTLDSYINWVWFRVTGAGFPVDDYPNFADHDRRMAERPAVKRALAREAIGQAELKQRGLVFSPPPRNSNGGISPKPN